MASPASSDEGEIRDTGSEKATTSLSQLDGTSVDRGDRIQSRYSKSRSPDSYPSGNRSYRERSRSPYSDRAPRGSKRPRDDDPYDRSHRDPRRFKVHYEDRVPDYSKRPHKSYEDLDRGSTTSSDLRYDDRDRYHDRRTRNRSRSPYRSGRVEREAKPHGRVNREEHRPSDYAVGQRDTSVGYDEQSSRGSREHSVSSRANGSVPSEKANRDTKLAEGSSRQHNDSLKHSSNQEEEQPSKTSENAGEDPEYPEPLDEAALIEQRRKRREAIKAKYRGSATPMLVQALQLGDKSTPTTPNRSQQGEDETQSTRSASPVISAPGTPKELQDQGSPGAFAITNNQDLVNANGVPVTSIEDGPSAADYDPTLDMREDRQRDGHHVANEVSSREFDETKEKLEQDVLLPTSATSQDKKSNSKDDFDMFAEDDDDDMFAEEPAPKAKNVATEGVSKAVPIPEAKELDVGMLDNWDDAEGYYKIILGELLNGRYHVQANLGRGMFSAVVRATDVTNKSLVAIKIIRNNETMRKAGFKEIEILQKLKEADPDDKKHLIRLERYFEHKGHLCMVFENLSINLREVLKKFGRDVGINLRAVRAYAQQMFLGLSLMRKCNIIHADLKPDNMLVNESRNLLKICDLGSASDSSENEITPYLVSRFYRAPEIILGKSYDSAIDIWSVGCTLYELYTGKILFTGRSNNQMLRSIMECRGKFTTKMLRNAHFAHIHFDDMANLKSVEQDKLTGKDTVKILSFAKPTRDLRTRLLGSSKGLTDAEMKELNLFVDLLDRCLALNPERRCTPTEALKHPFINRAGR